MTSGKTWILGIQHVLAMYAGAVVVPILVGGALKLSAVQMAYLISADLFTCGIATLLQVLGTRWLGVGLPVVLGCTFTAVGPLISIGLTDNLPTAFGAILVAGLVVVVLAPVFGRLLALFPTVVTGSVVTVIGLSLIPVAMNDAAGGQGSPDFGQPVNLLLALFTLLVILLLNRWARGFLRAISVLIGLVLGTLAAAVFGKVSLQSVAQANWMGLIHPLYFGRPQFHLAAIVTMCVVCVVSMVESTGVYFALSRITGRELKDADVVRGLRAEGVAIVLGGLFNTFPYTTFSQNVGLVSMTGVKKRSVVAAAGVLLIILGFLPKIAALTTEIPSSVLGGAMIAMFGMVVASGLNILKMVDLHRQENMLVVACSVAVGLGVAVVPQMFDHLPGALKMLLQSGIVMGSATAVGLNLLLNRSSVRSVTAPDMAMES